MTRNHPPNTQAGPGAIPPNEAPQALTPPTAAPSLKARILGAWQRFLDQKTVPQRLLLAITAVVTSLTVIAGGVYATRQALPRGDESRTAPSEGRSQGRTVVLQKSPGRTVVRQQSPEADQFVLDLIAAARDTGTIRLDHRVYEQPGRLIFTDSDLRLVYNCRPAKGCDIVRLGFPNGHDNRPRVVEDDEAAMFLGQYSVQVTRGVDFGDDALDIAFVFLGA